MKIKKVLISLLSLMLSVFIFSSCALSEEEKKSAALYTDNYALPASYLKYWTCVYTTAFIDSFAGDKDKTAFLSSKTEDGVTYSEYIKEWSKNHARDILISHLLFEENRLSLDSEVKKSIDEQIASFESDAGSAVALDTALSRFGVTAIELREVFTLEAESDKVQSALFGEGGKYAPTTEDYERFYGENYMLLKFIVIYTDKKIVTDENGDAVYDSDGNVQTEPLTNEEKQKKKKKTDEIIAAIENGSDFDSLTKEYSEADTSQRTDGFVINKTADTSLPAALVRAARECAEGETATVQSDGATYIIYRLPLPALDELSSNQLEDIADFTVLATRDKTNKVYEGYYEKITVNESATGRLNPLSLPSCRKYVYTPASRNN